MAPSGKRPAIRAEKHVWERLGRLLERRRAQLGYPTRSRFARDRKVRYERLAEIENASRPDPSSWSLPMLESMAYVYRVTPESMMAVLREEADELVPDETAAPPAGSRGKRPAIRADRNAWIQLGKLLQRRRAQIGGGSQTGFAKDRKVSVRRIRDIENASREDPSSWQVATLQEIAGFYEVTYDSVMAVLTGEADELVPAAPLSAGPSAAPALPGLPPAPDSALLREDADRPYATPIWEALLYLKDQGIADPDGDQLVAAVADLIRLGVLPGGTLPLSGRDAQAWDSTAGAMVRSDRVWAVSDLRRRREAFSAGSQQAASSA